MYKNKYDIVVEKLSYISFELIEDEIILVDELRDKRFKINRTAYEFCNNIDGIKDLQDISIDIAKIYNIDSEIIKEDIWDLYKFLKKNKLIIAKGSFIYKLLKFYQVVTFQKM